MPYISLPMIQCFKASCQKITILATTLDLIPLCLYSSSFTSGIGGSSQSPRLNAQTTSTTQSHNNNIKSIWFDFCLDLGPEKLVIVLLLILLLSLYIAYVATDLSRTYDTRIPITDDMLHTEL